MVKRITSKNTKAEIMEAYEEMRQEKTALESQVKKLNQEGKTGTTSAKSLGTKNDLSVNKRMVVKFQPDLQKTIDSLEQLKIGFGSAVSNLSEQLIAEAATLEQLQESVTEELAQLNELHEIESVMEESLDTLIDSYNENAKTFAEELNQSQETWHQQIQELRKSWEKEQENHQRDIQDRDESYQKEWEREEEEYDYNLKLGRDLAEEEYQQHKKNLYKELSETRQEQEKAWQQRENNIVEQEKEYQEAKEKVAIFEEQLEKKTKQGKEEGKGIGSYQAKVKADLRSKEIEGERQNYQLRIESLESTIENQETRIISLSEQLEAALKQVQDLAVKAIEGTSNRQSLEAMKEIALEQAKNTHKGK